MKKIFCIIILLCANIPMMAQSKSFIVTDKSGNSQIVQTLVFQKDELGEHFSWDTNRNGYRQANDISNVLSISRGEVSEVPTTDAVAVDLGLPSGTLWADRNVGSSKPEDHGGYYAWGETEEKEVYGWENYIHCDGSSSTFHDIGMDIAGTEYDVAHVKWGGSWKMPTVEQVKELLYNCTSEWTTVNSVYGRKFIGPNDNSIFLPAAGCRNNSDLYFAGSYGDYWSSALMEDDPFIAFGLNFCSDWASWLDYHPRCYGYSVRPVR